MIDFTVTAPARGKQRPRFNRQTGRAYTPTPTRIAEARVHDAWARQGAQRMEGPLALLVVVHLERPGSHFKRDGSLTAAGARSQHPTKTPDFDNFGKLIGDSLNKSAYRDDAQIVYHGFLKRWAARGERESTRVVICPMDAALAAALLDQIDVAHAVARLAPAVAPVAMQAAA